jgi:hypothetical protein
VIAPEQDRLTQLLGELATRADGTRPADRVDRVHGRARRAARVRIVASAAVAAVVVIVSGALLTRGDDLAGSQPPGGSPTPAVSHPSPSTPSHVTTTTPTPAPSTPTPTAQPTRSLVPADSQYPAAGTCSFVAGTVVTVTMDPDVPSPRCVSLRAGQELRVVNRSALLGSPAVSITVRWADYPARVLKPGESTTFADPAGSYLAVGVHRVGTAPLYGGQPAAEVWLH